MTFHAPLAMLAGLFVLSIAVASPEARVGGHGAPAVPVTVAFLR
ncbi:hypothetical protein [Roseicyclus persicicus]|nr:hypothetical protein [Roseibacterium persicicum]